MIRVLSQPHSNWATVSLFSIKEKGRELGSRVTGSCRRVWLLPCQLDLKLTEGCSQMSSAL